MDDQSIWAEEEFTGTSGDFDWTALGLDCLGTQLLQPGPLVGSEAQTSTLSAPIEQQPQPDVDLLFGDNNMAVSMEAAQVAMADGSTDHHHVYAQAKDLQPSDMIFPNSLLASPSPPHPQSSSSATNTSTFAPVSSTTSPSTGSEPSASTGGTKRPAEDDDNSQDASVKRQRNTMAARRYRQRRVDRLTDLEKRLADMTSERDELRVKLARREAEVGALREVLSAKK